MRGALGCAGLDERLFRTTTLNGLAVSEVTSLSEHEPGKGARTPVELTDEQRDLLSLCTFLAPEAEIPYAMLLLSTEFLSSALAAAVGDPQRFRALLQDLGSKNMLVTRKHGFFVNPEALRQPALRMDNDAMRAWTNAAYRCLERAYSRAETGEAILALIPHLRVISKHVQRAGLPLFPVSTLIYSAGLFLHEHGRSAEAVPLIRDSVDLCLMVGEENHPLIATRTNSLGLAYQSAGKLSNARDCFERALKICETVFGPTEHAVFTSADERFLTHPLRNLCRVLMEMGEPEAIQKAYDRALDVYLQVHGPYHPLVAECANDMGHVWHEMGNLKRAALHFEKAIESESKSKEPVPGNLAAYYVNLGTVRLQQEELEQAEDLYRQALEADTRDFGPDSAAVGRDLTGLGEVLRQQDDNESALEALERALKIAEAQDAPEPAEMRLLTANLGRVTASLREYETSAAYHRRALELSLSTHGPHAPQTSRDYFSLGRALMFIGLASEAVVHFERALEIEAELSGDDSERCATVLVNLGEALEHSGDHARARSTYDEALRIDRQNFGEEHEAVARDLYRIGNFMAQQGDSVSAIATLNRALVVTENVLGRDHTRARKIRRKLSDLSIQRK